MHPQDFDYICALVRQRSAIVLEKGKETLVESRLSLLLRRESIDTIEELMSRLKDKPYSTLHERTVESMTTNETLFFRDILPFDALRLHILPQLIKKREAERRLTILSAGCSSGQEPYSIAMLLKESFPQTESWQLRLLACDISKEMISRAKEGRFSQFEVNRGLPASYLVKYFQQQGIEWFLQDNIRRMVEFFDTNLAEAWPLLPNADVVLLRNVLIYFDVETKKGILARVRKILRPDGFLFLGSAETTLNLDDAFERVQFDKSWCYRLHA